VSDASGDNSRGHHERGPLKAEGRRSGTLVQDRVEAARASIAQPKGSDSKPFQNRWTASRLEKEVQDSKIAQLNMQNWNPPEKYGSGRADRQLDSQSPAA